MPMCLKDYDSQKHDRQTIARLIFESDPVFNTNVYGKDAPSVIEETLRLGATTSTHNILSAQSTKAM